jgi:hypothetical protein
VLIGNLKIQGCIKRSGLKIYKVDGHRILADKPPGMALRKNRIRATRDPHVVKI